ncbi:MAG TPA: hypothetical protein VJW77_04225 [Terriglobia bacterium]|nr:hypothetical protein [Terriglobia bacterium]
MITITVTKTSTIEYKVAESFVKTEKPTDKVKQSQYGDRTEVLFERTYETHEVPRTKEQEIKVFEQRIEDSKFDLAAVISAVNGL